MGLAFVISFLFIMFAYYFVPELGTDKTLRHSDSIVQDKLFFVLFMLSFMTSCVLAAFFSGYSTDMSCWRAWGERMYLLGPSEFYSADYFCDYPPGYIYILGFMARLGRVFNLSQGGISFLYKLPAIISDAMICSILYRLGKRYFDAKSALILSCLFMLAPIFRFDSAVWGQIESVLIVFLLISVLYLCEKKYTLGVIFYVLAVLTKPQALIAAPVYLYALISSHNIKQILISVASGIIFLFALTIPFSPAWKESSGIFAFISSLNPLWLIGKYTGTISSYPYFSVNAFNLYGLLGLNWVSFGKIGNPELLSVINAAVITAACAGSAYIYFKVKNPGSKTVLSCYFLFGFIFTFAFKMHERYIILPSLFLLLDYFFSKNKKMLGLFAAFSTIGYLNIFYILQLAETTNTAPSYIYVASISLGETLTFLISIWIIYKEYICNSKAFNCSLKFCGDKTYNKKIYNKLLHKDTVCAAAITILYAVTAFINLGDVNAPQTYYKPALDNDFFVIEFEKCESVSYINYYCGIGDVNKNPALILEYSDDGDSWSTYPQNVCKFNSVFRWEASPLGDIKARYLRFTAQSSDYTLFELGFFDSSENLINIKSIRGSDSSNYSAVIDEQKYVAKAPSYKNGTYFDEIYHPRTAYEHLHLMKYYETTHPPLGKLIISIGIAIFGMSPFGWRCMGTLFGVLMLPMLYLLLKKIFGKTRFCVIGTLLFAFDFMHYSLTRMGTIDSYPVFFIICMYCFMYDFGKRAFKWADGGNSEYTKMLRSLCLSGLFMGLGCASKWTAVYASIGLGIEFFAIMFIAYKKTIASDVSGFKTFAVKILLWCMLFFIAVPMVVYLFSYLPITLTGQYGNIFQTMWNNQKYMLSYHSDLRGTHPYSSSWYTWPFVYRPMWAYQAPDAALNTGQIGCISIFQNPLLSWSGIAAFIYSLYVGVKKKDYKVLFLTIGLAAQMVPWMFVKRYTLQYHYFASIPFVICFIVYAMYRLEEKYPKFKIVSNAFTVSCIILFIIFYPVITGIPCSKEWVETMLVWFKSWVFYI